ncbi:hypothetical protein H0A36_26535 [Endozoicomonas sp. SM1973]|uniref:Uncharacterized protein n=1 Tax=Spartinivicinus marinus TaxID=2994442 RepID=A0A853IJK7_9GAMM|nr:hypothetical protein [Spartinivicinus marinus]MCX4030226.1 hypothetical protein [Spartinivicinus marinus]NYZ69577.1 hypothetical protein [Spartinivicinus marinus]
MNIEEIEKAIRKMDKKHHIFKWFSLVMGIWLFLLPVLPDSFPYLDWLRVEDPNTIYTMMGVFSVAWAIDNWRTTKELRILKATLKIAKKNAWLLSSLSSTPPTSE